MNKSRFDEIIKNRAQERVQEKVKAFREAVIKAVKELGLNEYKHSPNSAEGWWPRTVDASQDLNLVLQNVAKGLAFEPKATPASLNDPYKPLCWPAILWRTEEAKVEKELLATMDEMQKALVAAPATESTIKPADEPAAP